MLATAWCIIVIFSGILGIGVPIRWLVGGRKPFGETAWLQVPFFGIATIILLLQNLVYLDIPIGQTFWIIWLGMIPLWLWMIRSNQLRLSAQYIPRSICLAAVAVYLLQSLGLLLVGAQRYVGRAWPDQFNYTTIAQFLIDVRFNLTAADIGSRPYLANALWLKGDRIGQSVLHGFFAASSFRDAKMLFEPVILLSPSLIALPTYMICRRLGVRTTCAVLAGTTASLLPSITLLHQESFMSHALGLPFLLLWPIILDELIHAPNRYSLARAAILFTAATSVYTEFWIILLVIAIFMLVLAALRSPYSWKLLGYCIVIALSPIILLPLFTPALIEIFSRLDLVALQHIYPWAFQLEGVARIWLGDFVATPEAWQRYLGIALGVVATVLAYCGLTFAAIRQLIDKNTWRDYSGWRTLILRASLLAIVVSPLGVLVRGTQNPYQFYKLLITVSPLFAVGLAVLASSHQGTARGEHETRNIPIRMLSSRPFAFALFVMMLIISAASTVSIAIQSTSLQPNNRNYERILLAPDIRALEERLGQLHNANLLIADISTPPTSFATNLMNGWMTYFARDNQIWLDNPMVNGTNLKDYPQLSHIINVSSIPDDILVLTSKNNDDFFKHSADRSERIWSNNTYHIIKTTPRSWFLLTQFHNPNGKEKFRGQPFFWIGKGVTTIEVLTLEPGVLTIGGTLSLGPSLPGKPVRRLRVSTTAGYGEELRLVAGDSSIDVRVPVGTTTISIQSLDQPTQLQGPNHDRPLLLGVQSPWIQFQACK